MEVETCLSVAAGDHVLVARLEETADNGGLPAVDLTFDFALSNSDTMLWVGTDETTLDVVTWSSSSA